MYPKLYKLFDLPDVRSKRRIVHAGLILGFPSRPTPKAAGTARAQRDRFSVSPDPRRKISVSPDPAGSDREGSGQGISVSPDPAGDKRYTTKLQGATLFTPTLPRPVRGQARRGRTQVGAPTPLTQGVTMHCFAQHRPTVLSSCLFGGHVAVVRRYPRINRRTETTAPMTKTTGIALIVPVPPNRTAPCRPDRGSHEGRTSPAMRLGAGERDFPGR